MTNTLASKLAAQARDPIIRTQAEASGKEGAGMPDILPDATTPEAPANPAEAGAAHSTIVTGTVGFGQGMQNAGNAQGRARTSRRMPGYYSVHMGRIYLKGRVIEWPIHSPLNPSPDDTDLIAYLDHQVKCKRAEYVKPEDTEE